MSRRVTAGTVHEPTDACGNVHCYGCGQDHTGTPWRWCFECGHAWTPRELRRAYRRALVDDARLLDRPLFRSNEWLMSLTSVLWLALTARASRITFCQLCLHDF